METSSKLWTDVLRKVLAFDVRDRCLLQDSHVLFSQNNDQLIFRDELESPMKGRHDCTYYSSDFQKTTVSLSSSDGQQLI